jgi:RimJ/RimL family protein N-acetyltransferase
MARMPDVIEAERVRLERWSTSHADAAYRALRASAEEVGAWLAWARAIRSRGQLLLRIELEREQFERDESYEYFVLDGTDVVGGCGAGFEGDVASIGYWVRTDRAGEGIATEAADALGRAVFASCDVPALQIECDRGNPASAAVARKLGYEVVGERTFEPVTPGHTGVEVLWRLSAPGPST